MPKSVVDGEVILFKLAYVSDERYPNKKNRGEKDPKLIFNIGKLINHMMSPNYIFHSANDSIENLIVAKQPGKIYRDTVWFKYIDHSKENIKVLRKKAIEIFIESKQKKLDEALLTVKCMKETIEFLEECSND